MTLRKRIYLAGPITGESKSYEKRNVERAVEIGKQLFAAGWAPFVPHLSWFAEEAFEFSHEEWLELDFPWVAVADAVFRMNGDSVGATKEVNLAHMLGIPVLFENGEIPSPEALEGLGVGASTRKDEGVVNQEQAVPDLATPGNSPSNILKEAEGLVYGPRQDDYGHPLHDFSRTAGMWTYLFGDLLKDGAKFGPEHIPLAMVCVKLSREMNRPKRDNGVDGVGYLGTLELVREKIGGW